MGYQASKVEMSNEHQSLLPKSDSAYSDYMHFKATFGEEGNIIVIGVQDSQFFELEHFQAWSAMAQDLENIHGVDNMISPHNAFQVVKNKDEKKFEIQNIFEEDVKTQTQLDSLAGIFHKQLFFDGYLSNESSGTYSLVLTMNKDMMKSVEREQVVLDIRNRCMAYEKQMNQKIHYSGLPYIRVMNTILIKKEIFLFTGLALLICMIILFLFFRSFKAMLYPSLVVFCGVIISVGTVSLLGYKITLLTGMVPPLLIVIGIPNSIFMINKYHNEYRLHGNKIKALQRVIVKIGNAIFLTNLTTASGFATFTVTSSQVLREFGVVASINILLLFVISLLMIPSIFSFLKEPGDRHLKHLDRKGITKVIDRFVSASIHHPKYVAIATFALLTLSIVGLSKMKTTGYMVDDIPKDDPIYIDLKFFEEEFDGLMPLEIIIDTKKPKGAISAATLKRLDRLDQKLASYDELSSSISVLSGMKVAKQAFYNGNPKYYALPNSNERNFILSYLGGGDGDISLLNSFIDSTQQITRVSIRVKDIGTSRMQSLYTDIKADVDAQFPPEKYDVTITGSSVVSFRGIKHLVNSLFTSLALAIGLIAVFMSFMFRSFRMVFTSLIPNLVPLLFTAGVMGWFGIPIKASTVLVFSIAFGISVDNTIHFLAKYRQELKSTGWDIKRSVVLALRETGVSMLYTSTVLFFGFGIFSLSNFGGTQALGILVSLTLFIALLSNLVLLPTLLMRFERLLTTRSFKEPLLDIYNEEDDIDFDELEILTEEEIQNLKNEE